MFARLPGGDDRFRDTPDDVNGPSDASDALEGEALRESLESPRLVPTSGDVGDSVYTVEFVLETARAFVFGSRSTGPMGPGDLASSSTNASATRSSAPGLASSETSLESDPGVAGDAGAGAPARAVAAEKESSEEGEAGKYTVGVALARAPRDRADSNLGLAGGRDATAPDATLPGVDIAAPADIQTSEESELGLDRPREAEPASVRRAAAPVETPSDSKSEPDEPQSECGGSPRRRRANGDATRLKKRRGGEGFFFPDESRFRTRSCVSTLVRSASAPTSNGAARRVVAFAFSSALASARMRCTVSSVALRMGPVEETSRHARNAPTAFVARAAAASAEPASSETERKASSSAARPVHPANAPASLPSRLAIVGSPSRTKAPAPPAPRRPRRPRPSPRTSPNPSLQFETRGSLAGW